MAADSTGTEVLDWHGHELLLRPIGPLDDARHGDFFAHLAAYKLRMRFFSSQREVPHVEIERLVHPDAAHELAFMLLGTGADGISEEVATARAVAGADNLEAEFGITFRSDLKGRAWGSCYWPG